MKIVGWIVLTLGFIFYFGIGLAMLARPCHRPNQYRLPKETRGLTLRLSEHLNEKARLPLADKHSSDTVIPTDSYFVTELNKDGIYLSSDAHKFGFLDLWDNPYYILFDYDGDGRLTEPPTLGELTFTDKSFLIWSAGPDGKYGSPKTNRDNYYNYPGHIESYSNLPNKQQNTRTLLFLLFVSSGIITIYLWITKFHTYPLFAALHRDVFSAKYKRHLKKAKFVILPLIFFEILLCLISINTSHFIPIALPSFILSLACLYLVFIHIPRLQKLTVDRSLALADLTTIPAILWTVKIIAIIARPI